MTEYEQRLLAVTSLRVLRIEEYLRPASEMDLQKIATLEQQIKLLQDGAELVITDDNIEVHVKPLTEQKRVLRAEIDYTNHRGVRDIRYVKNPRPFYGVYPPYYTTPQWLVIGHDEDRDAERVFAQAKIHSWNSTPVAPFAFEQPQRNQVHETLRRLGQKAIESQKLTDHDAANKAQLEALHTIEELVRASL